MNPSSRPSRRLRLLSAAVLGLTALAAPPAASASCAGPVGDANLWRTADIVFVGTVTDVANNARWATVRVEEVWQGPDQPVEVVVRGGPEGNMATSIDRTFVVGMRYLFGVATGEGGVLVDNACSGTIQADAIDLDALRPGDVRSPIGGAPIAADDGLDLSGVGGPLILAAVVGGLLLVTVLLANRRAT